MPYQYQARPKVGNMTYLDVNSMKEHLKKKKPFTGVCNWGDDQSMRITLKTPETGSYILLEYVINREDEVRNKIFIDTVPSNLGTGEIYYFICPRTGRRCRKLYLYRGYFMSRKNIPGVIYHSQTKSRCERALEDAIGSYKDDQLLEELNKPYLKTHYRGKPTKTYKRITDKINKRRQKRVSLYKGEALISAIIGGGDIKSILNY